MNNNSNIFWVIEVSIKDEGADAFRTLMNEMVESTKINESETLNYEWFISSDGTKCHIYERYANSEAVITHLKTFGEKFAERFTSVVTPTNIVVYGNPKDEVIKALTVFGAVFMLPIGGFSR